MIANEAGADASALAARRRLAPLLEKIQDPLLHAVCQLAMPWTSPITGDSDGALREASVILEHSAARTSPSSLPWPPTPPVGQSSLQLPVVVSTLSWA